MPYQQTLTRNKSTLILTRKTNRLNLIKCFKNLLYLHSKSLQKDCRGKLPSPINFYVEDILNIKFEINPRTTVWNNPRRVKDFSTCMRLSLIMRKKGPWRTMHLTNNNSLDPINHKRSIRTHHWQFAQKYFLLLNLPDDITDNLSNFLPSNHINHFWSNLSTRREKHLPRRGTLKIFYNIFTQ